MITDFLQTQKEVLSVFLKKYLETEGSVAADIHSLGKEAFDKLLTFTCRGKMLRGSLAILGHKLFSEEFSVDLLKAAAALELFQSALLIHDDIMDRDKHRRGAPSIFHQYQQELTSKGMLDADHTGQSLGICSGDIAFFLGYNLMSSVNSAEKDPAVESLLQYASRELSFVAVAQMVDVYRGVDPAQATEEDILHLYAYKTGRYTFSMPLKTGAILAGERGDKLKLLHDIGEVFGVIFQIKDDELGLFGEGETLGKPLGSDFKEGKKTLYSIYLANQASPRENEILSQLREANEITPADLKFIHGLIDKYTIKKRVGKTVNTLSKRLQQLVSELNGVRKEGKIILGELIDYSLNRTK